MARKTVLQDVVNRRCFHHPSREAVALCPECGCTFCRECVTEHEGRVVCSTCLAAFGGRQRSARRAVTALAAGLWCLLQVLLAWTFFHALGQLLLRVPSSFHEGTVWERVWQQAE